MSNPWLAGVPEGKITPDDDYFYNSSDHKFHVDCHLNEWHLLAVNSKFNQHGFSYFDRGEEMRYGYSKDYVLGKGDYLAEFYSMKPIREKFQTHREREEHYHNYIWRPFPCETLFIVRLRPTLDAYDYIIVNYMFPYAIDVIAKNEYYDKQCHRAGMNPFENDPRLMAAGVTPGMSLEDQMNLFMQRPHVCHGTISFNDVKKDPQFSHWLSCISTGALQIESYDDYCSPYYPGTDRSDPSLHFPEEVLQAVLMSAYDPSTWEYRLTPGYKYREKHPGDYRRLTDFLTLDNVMNYHPYDINGNQPVNPKWDDFLTTHRAAVSFLANNNIPDWCWAPLLWYDRYLLEKDKEQNHVTTFQNLNR